MKEPAHRALHPFGQIPTYEEGDLALFETGAIVFHIAQRHAGLLPGDANARARAITVVRSTRWRCDLIGPRSGTPDRSAGSVSRWSWMCAFASGTDRVAQRNTGTTIN